MNMKKKPTFLLLLFALVFIAFSIDLHDNNQVFNKKEKTVSPRFANGFKSLQAEPALKSDVHRDSGYVTYIQDFLPFQQVSRNILDSSGRKILTHWHSFVLAFRNERESEDHYTTYRLNPNNSKFASTGGQMRQRPYYRPPRDGEKSFLVQDFETEINTFMDIGGDGFFLNMISKPFNETGGGRWNHYYACSEAAANVSNDFAIIPSPDCGATFKQQNVEDFVKIMNWIKEHPNRMEIDGKLPFLPGILVCILFPSGMRCLTNSR